MGMGNGIGYGYEGLLGLIVEYRILLYYIVSKLFARHKSYLNG
jgi:hypothetical protein